MLEKINFEILNGFINMIIINVAQKYLDKLKKEEEKPPKLIEDYLDSAIYLIQKYQKIEISKMQNTIIDIDKEEQKKFNKFFEQNKEYEILCKELNFAFLLMIDSELQERTLELIDDNIYEYKILVNQEIITKKQINVDNVIEKSNKKKINKLRVFKTHNYGFINV